MTGWVGREREMMMERSDIPGMQSTLKSFHCYVSTLMDCGLNKKKFTRSFYRDLPCTRIGTRKGSAGEEDKVKRGDVAIPMYSLLNGTAANDYCDPLYCYQIKSFH